MSKKKISLGILGILLIIFPFVIDSPYILSLAIQICIFGIYALSYDLLLGYTGIVSFGHALFFGGGAYITAILMKTYRVPYILALFVVIIACLAIGLAMGALSIRAKDIYFSMLTMALGQFFFVLIIKGSEITGGDDGFHGVRSFISDRKMFYYFILVILLLVYLFAKRLISSPTGRVLQAIRENEFRAGMIGYNVLNYKLLVILISGVIAGFAGSLYVIFVGSAYPALIHSDMTMKALFMTVLGGMGTLTGPILGSILVTVAENTLSNVMQRWMLIFGMIYVFIILFFPGGLARIKQTISKKRLLSKAAKSKGVQA